jgi:macrodomain Ter protein organizer (MatP/YcbG family)
MSYETGTHLKSHYKIQYLKRSSSGEYEPKYMDWNNYDEVVTRLRTLQNNPKIKNIVILRRNVYDVTEEF